MRTVVLAVGRVKDGHIAALCADFLKRASRLAPTELVEVKDAKGRDPAEARRVEGERLLARIDPRARVVLLDEGGRDLTSVQLAEELRERADGGCKELVFVVGGPWGHAEAVRARANATLRLGAVTLTHELARLVLLEQVYRAWTIQRGLPYHHV